MAIWRRRAAPDLPRAGDEPIGIWGDWLSRHRSVADGHRSLADWLSRHRADADANVKRTGLLRFTAIQSTLNAQTIQSMLNARRLPDSAESAEERYARALQQVGCWPPDCKYVAKMMVLKDKGDFRSVAHAARLVEQDIPQQGRTSAPQSIQKRLYRRYKKFAQRAQDIARSQMIPNDP